MPRVAVDYVHRFNEVRERHKRHRQWQDVAVVATDADGVLHMVRDRQSAMVSAVGDHVGLADRIIELIEDPALTEKLSINGRFEAQKYTWSRVRQDWVNLYSNLTA
jgi:glycosyltransferase involved in cell wall biosynthesis